MQTELISITQSLKHIDNQELTPEELIVYVARVSNPSNQHNVSTSKQLLQFLIKHKHWSPFEMVDMTISIHTSRAIAQQILRHRSFSFQEFSQRYATAQTFEPIDLRYQATHNRQSSEQTIDDDLSAEITPLINDHLQSSHTLYDTLIAKGVSKETARFILPLTTTTHLYMKGSIRSWIHYFQIRTATNTQLEHRQIAHDMQIIFSNHFPIIAQCLYEGLA